MFIKIIPRAVGMIVAPQLGMKDAADNAPMLDRLRDTVLALRVRRWGVARALRG